MAETASVGDQRVRLEGLRDKLAVALESCSENMLPQLAGQYRATLADLSALPDVAAVVKSTRDELKERRESKHDPVGGSEAQAVSASVAKGGKRRS